MTVAAGASLQAGSYMTGCVVHDSPSGGVTVQGNLQVQQPVQAATLLQQAATQAVAACSLGHACDTSVKQLCKRSLGPHTMSGLLFKGLASLPLRECCRLLRLKGAASLTACSRNAAVC